jgi:hypothetical protein
VERGFEDVGFCEQGHDDQGGCGAAWVGKWCNWADGQLWDLKTYKIRIDLPGHTDEVYCVDFVADKVVSGGADKTVKM